MEYLEFVSENNRVLRGMYHKSGNPFCNPVIIVHGYFSANRIGPQRLFVKMANAICKVDFDVYRFDLSGMGESDGDISEITFKDHVKDVFNIINFVRSRHNNVKICVIAHCLGSNVTLANVIVNPNFFREIIFLAPYYTTDAVLAAFFSKESIYQLSNENHTYRNGLFAHSSFFKESMQKDFVESMKKLSVAVDVVIAEKDQFIPLESNHSIFDCLNNVNTVYLSGADHNFLEYNNEVISLLIGMLTDGYFTS